MSKIIKWGNSLAIRIPYKLAEELNLIEGGEVVLEVKDNQLIIKKEKPATRKLLKLLDGHDPLVDYIDSGKPQGNEEW